MATHPASSSIKKSAPSKHMRRVLLTVRLVQAWWRLQERRTCGSAAEPAQPLVQTPPSPVLRPCRVQKQ